MTLSTEMTPRARRMILYCVVGFVGYLFVLLSGAIQDLHIVSVDKQLESIENQLNNYEIVDRNPPLTNEISTPSQKAVIPIPVQ